MEYNTIVEAQRAWFRTGQTLDVSFRIEQLKKLKSLIINHEEKIKEALFLDLAKPTFETLLAELDFVLHDLAYQISQVRRWAKPQKVKTPLLHFPASSYIYPEPYGCVLVISPWNYPFQLAMAPLVGAIAAGNCVMLKPSEYSPATSRVLEEIINPNFDPGFMRVVQGGAEETQALLQQRFDYIFFTGSTAVGKIIMKAAAEHLTPLTLELGGKSPAIVDPSANLKVSARRIIWGKFFNAGQTCIAPDYLWVHESLKDQLARELTAAIHSFFGDDPSQSEDYGRIISKRHFDRLTSFIQPSQILCGGQTDEQTKYIAPTILQNVGWHDPVMQEEIFGPLLPVLTYKNTSDVIAFLKQSEKPLAMYIFSKDKGFINTLLTQTSAGGVCINEPLSHITSKHLPFGGVGQSGMGSYHGYYSFTTFSHNKSVMQKTFFPDPGVKYPPYRKISPLIRRILKIIN